MAVACLMRLTKKRWNLGSQCPRGSQPKNFEQELLELNLKDKESTFLTWKLHRKDD